MIKQVLLINLLLFSIGQNAVAANPTISNENQLKPIFNDNTNCENTTDLSQMNDCAVKTYQIADKRLQELHQQLLAAEKNGMDQLLSNQEQKLFQQAHNSWLKFRDDYCGFAANAVKDEPGYPFHQYDCLRRLTKQYINNLEKYIEDLDV